MAATFVQGFVNDTGVPAAGGTLSFGTNVVAGNTLALGLFGWYTATAPTSVTDTQGNTWTFNALATFITGTSRIYTTTASSSGACTVTVSAAGSQATYGSFLMEISGLQASPYDTSSTTVANTTSPVNAGSLTPTANGDFLIAYFSRAGVFSSYSNNGVFSVQSQSPSNNSNAIFTYTQPTAGAITPDGTATVNGSYQVRGIAMAFKAAASGVVANSNFLMFFP